MHKNRISKLFDILKTKNKSALGVFITAGDPNLEVSQKILDNLPSKFHLPSINPVPTFMVFLSVLNEP